MNKLLIIQSIGDQAQKLQAFIKEHFPKLFGEIITTDSFEHALLLIAKEKSTKDMCVLTSWMFHDGLSEHRILPATVSDKEKDGDLLAKMIKEINPNIKVYVYSEYSPNSGYVDEYIMKDPRNTNMLVEFLKKLG